MTLNHPAFGGASLLLCELNDLTSVIWLLYYIQALESDSYGVLDRSATALPMMGRTPIAHPARHRRSSPTPLARWRLARTSQGSDASRKLSEVVMRVNTKELGH